MSVVDGVWVDGARCTACGACIDACPTGAIALVSGHAQIDEAACQRCGVCMDVCPANAIQPVVTVATDLEPVAEAAAPVSLLPHEDAATLRATVVTAGVGLALHVVRSLVDVGLSLLQRRGVAPDVRSPAARTAGAVTRGYDPGGAGRGRGGRRARTRRRGRGS